MGPKLVRKEAGKEYFRQLVRDITLLTLDLKEAEGTFVEWSPSRHTGTGLIQSGR